MAVSRPLNSGEFDPLSESIWRAAVEKALDGAPPDSLNWMLEQDISVNPIYQRALQDLPMAGRPIGSAWRVHQRIDHPDIAVANHLVRDAIDGGATGLSLVPNGAPSGFGFGLDLSDPASFNALFAGIELAGLDLRIEPSPSGRRVAQAYRTFCRQEHLAPASQKLSFGLDPIGNLAARGDLADDWPQVAKRLADLAWECETDGFVGPPVEADGRPYHNAGASPAMELAAILATAVCYLRALTQSGSLEMAARAIGLSVCTDADQFVSLAKIRALRMVWAQVCKVCGLELQPVRIHAQTSWRMMTQRDPHVNLLRTTVAAFSAGVGGADSVSVLPFTQALGLTDDFSRRLALNIQHILIEESNLHRVSDPASGSGYVSRLTGAIAEKAWSHFRDIEAAGGIVSELKSGRLQTLIGEAKVRRRSEIDHRGARLTGTTEFPNLIEYPVKVLDIPARQTVPKPDAAIRIARLGAERDAAPFETLRDWADGVEATKGQRPVVHLISLDDPAQAADRINWVTNFLAAGGIAAVGCDAGGPGEATALAFENSGTSTACLCGSATALQTHGVATAESLLRAGAGGLVIAGRPESSPLNSLLVSLYIYEGCNALEALTHIRGLFEK